MKRIVLIILAIFILLSGCADTKPASRFSYRDEPVLKVTVSCIYAPGENKVYELEDEEIEKYLTLLEKLPDYSEWDYGMLFGMFPITLTITTDNKRYSLNCIPSIGLMYNSDYYSRDTLPDDEFMSFVRTLTYEKLHASDTTFLSMTAEGHDILPISDAEGKQRYIISGDAPAQDILKELGIAYEGEDNFRNYADALAGSWKVGSKVSFDSGKASLLWLGEEPDYYMVSYPDLKGFNYPVYFSDIKAEEIEGGIRKTFTVSRMFCDPDDVNLIVSSRSSYDPENFVQVTGEIQNLEPGNTYSVDFIAEQFPEDQKNSLLGMDALNCAIYQRGRLIFYSTLFSKTYDIINDYHRFSTSMKADYDMRYENLDADRCYGTGMNFDKNRSEDFVIEPLCTIRFGNNVYEYAVSIVPFFEREYDIDSIGIYDETGNLYVDKVAGEIFWDTDYHWKEYGDYQALVAVFSLHDPQQDKLYIRVNYNDGTVSEVGFRPSEVSYDWKIFAGRDDIVQIQNNKPYKALFTADRYRQDYYDKYDTGAVISAGAVRRLGNEKALALLKNKTQAEIEEVWGQPVRDDQGTLFYKGYGSLDEIAVSYDKDGKVSSLDYVNRYKGMVSNVNGHEINVSTDLGNVRVSVYKKMNDNQLAEYVQGAEVMISFRGLLYENRPEDIEIELVK